MPVSGLLQIHVLKSYSVSNLNRDRDGENKWVMFGGHRRARISSQCLKRSIRRSPQFTEAMAGLIANRTRVLPRLIVGGLDCTPEERDAILAVCRVFGSAPKEEVDEAGEDGDKKKKSAKAKRGAKENLSVDLTNQVLAFSDEEAAMIGREALAILRANGALTEADMAAISPIQDLTPMVDLALFGRMSTARALTRIDGAVYFSHAISANTCEAIADFFTAVDERVPGSGAGMMGEKSFAAPLHYISLKIDLDLLVLNLGGNVTLARNAVIALINGLLLTDPSGSQNSMSSNPKPSFAMFERSDVKIATDYHNAFLYPVEKLEIAEDRDLAAVARDQLVNFALAEQSRYFIERERVMFPDNDVADIGRLEQVLRDLI